MAKVTDRSKKALPEEDRTVDRDTRQLSEVPSTAGRQAWLTVALRPADPRQMLCCLLALVLLIPCPGRAEPVLIAHPSVPLTHLDRGTARLLFSLRRPQWQDGTPVHVYVLDDRDPLHIRFCREVLKLYPRQLRRVWDRQTFSGTGQAPNVVGSVEEMRDKVASDPGAIGYLPREEADDRVKILEVQ